MELLVIIYLFCLLMESGYSIKSFISPGGGGGLVSLTAVLTDACNAYSALVIIFSPLKIMTQNPSNHRSYVSSHYSISIMFRRDGAQAGRDGQVICRDGKALYQCQWFNREEGLSILSETLWDWGQIGEQYRSGGAYVFN